MEYDRHETVHKSEQTAFNTEGTIKTSDGKEIQFNLSLEMKREFLSDKNNWIDENDTGTGAQQRHLCARGR